MRAIKGQDTHLHTHKHTLSHSVVQPAVSKSVMRPQSRSTKKAEGVSQGGLRSHSDNQLASTSSPGFSVQSLGGMDGAAHPARQRAEVRGPLDVVSAGHRGDPSLIWCHKKAEAALPVPPALSAGLQLATDTQDTVKTSVCGGNFPNPLFTPSCQSGKHLEKVSKWS